MYNGIQNRFELKPHNAYHFTSLVKPICFSFLNYHDKRLHFKRGFLSIGIQSLTRTLIYDPALKMLEIVWWFVPLQNINHNGVLCLCLNWGSLSSLERVPNRLGGLMSFFQLSGPPLSGEPLLCKPFPILLLFSWQMFQ